MSNESWQSCNPVYVLDDEHVQALTGKTILVAGAGGYLGTALLSALHSVRCDLVALVHRGRFLPVPAKSQASLSYRQVDLAQSSVWPDVLRDDDPDVIINLAAHEHKRDSQHSPALDLAVNTATVLELLETCRDLDLRPRIVLASSANLAGCPLSNPVNEETPDQPLTLYAINKLVAEQYLRYYAETFDLPTVSLRFANVYGPLAARDKELESRVALNAIMRRALEGGPLTLYRNQDCVRDFVYVDDAIRAICAAATSNTIGRGSKYIVGSGEGFALREIISEIAQKAGAVLGQRIDVHHDEDARLAPIEWRNFVADYTRLQSATGWKPRIKLSHGIELTLSAFTGGQTH
jgi:nucleoside-diphosphate-sugar epimerase